jgi:hypothetical protein
MVFWMIVNLPTSTVTVSRITLILMPTVMAFVMI